jgi:hypothetical protein
MNYFFAILAVLSLTVFSKLLVAHAMSKILDLLISSLGKLANRLYLLEEVSYMIELSLLDLMKTMPKIAIYI